MNRLDETLIFQTATIRQAIERMEASSTKACIVTDAERRLLGTVTDGDVRRGILRGVALEEPVSVIMATRPHSISRTEDHSGLLARMREYRVKQIPVLNEDDRLVDLITMDDLLESQKHENWVVILAGGRGERLAPLTEETPKPMLHVGDRPILETTIRRCAASGFHQFFLSVNHQSEIIKSHFGTGQDLGVSIDYLEEGEPLGTVGSLALLPETTSMPILVINGDILTNVDLALLLSFHLENSATATIAVREYEANIPYGVVTVDHHRVTAIDEKPYKRYFINAGLYVLDPMLIKLIGKNQFTDMPELLDLAIQRGLNVSAFPIREYWVDIGHLDDYDRANNDFPKFF
jgi:dTDP-glucose pyrophosphorylase